MSIVAYALYRYNSSAVGVGMFGRAQFNGTSTITALTPKIGNDDPNAPNVTPDAKTFWFKNKDGAGRILLAQTYYNADYIAQPSIMCVYDENMNLVYGVQTTDPTDPGAKTWGGYTNLYAVTTGSDGTNYCLYCIDYDAAVIFRVIDAGGDSYTYDAASLYSYAPLSSAPTGTKGYGVDITTDGSAIYGLFINGTNVFTGAYSNSTVVKLPMTLGSTVSARNDGFAYNAFSLQLYTGGTSNELYVTAVGGMQNYGSSNGAASKIQKITTGFTSATAVTPLLSGGSIAKQGDFRALSFKADGSDVFILTGFYNTAGDALSCYFRLG